MPPWLWPSQFLKNHLVFDQPLLLIFPPSSCCFDFRLVWALQTISVPWSTSSCPWVWLMASLMCSMCFLRTWLPATLLPHSPGCQLHWAPWPCSLASAPWGPEVMLPTVVGPKSPAAGWESTNSFDKVYSLCSGTSNTAAPTPQVPGYTAWQGLAPYLLCNKRKQKALSSWVRTMLFLMAKFALNTLETQRVVFSCPVEGIAGTMSLYSNHIHSIFVKNTSLGIA